MNNALSQLQPYPFEKLRALLGSVTPNPDNYPTIIQRRVPRQLKHFAFAPQVTCLLYTSPSPRDS